jgi:tetratricopeptide (TPR) repeat protein
MVESVAWISEQKNTLSLVFYLAAALVYLRFDETRRPRAYMYATLLFACALLTKTVTASLPAALLVAGWWQRGRIDLRRDVAPLLPWFVLGAGMGLLSAHVERVYIGAQGEEFGLDGLQRSLLAGRIAWFYAAKLFWPAELIFIYPRWQVDPAQVGHWLYSLGALALLAGLWGVRSRSRAPLAAVLFFGGSLFPTLGFFNVYAFLYSFVADHWQYLPSLGLIVLASAGLARLLEARGVARAARVGVPVAIVSGLGLLSFQQGRMYVDLRTFYVTTLARNPAAWMAHNNLGNLLREAGELDAARGHFEAALRVRPDLHRVHNNLANVLRAQRQPAEAERHYRRAIELRPDYVEAHNNLGSLLRQAGRPAEAKPHLFAAILADPMHADARNNLGMTLRDLERNTDAIVQFQRALRLQPEMAAAHLNLALSFSVAGRNAEAAIHLREARRLNPRIPDLRLD